MKVLVCGDVHLTNYSMFNRQTENNAIGSRLAYILKALDYFFEYGAKNGITKFVINGDLFDKRQSDNPSTMAMIRYHIIEKYKHIDNYSEELGGEPCELFINTGNHDSFGRVPYPNAIQDFIFYSDSEHLIHVSNEVAQKEFDDSNLLFVPYSEKVDELKQDIKDALTKWKNGNPTYVFAHLGVTGGVQGRWNHRLSDAFNVGDLGWNDDNVRMIILNHFHNRSFLYPNVNGKVKLPSDNPTKYNMISTNTLDIIEYNFNNLGMLIDYEKGKLINRPTYVDNDGYTRTSLKGKDGKYHTIGVATIIAFRKYGRNGLINKQIDHINNNHGINDNYPDNLQVITLRDNLEKEMSDNGRRVACKAKNYFTGTEVHAKSIYELSNRIKVAVSSIHKCVQGKASVAGDYFVASENCPYKEDISSNHFRVQGKNLKTNKLTPVFNILADAERWLGLKAGNSQIGEVCRGTKKQCKGYTWRYVPRHPEAYYVGDLTELNFNDILPNGSGAPRGFDEIDTVTGEHKFIDLTKEPYNIPTFNQIDLEDGSNLGLDTLNPNNYYKITTKDRETYDHLSKERESLPNASNIQLVLIPQEIETDLDIDPNMSDNDLVAEYCKKNYPGLEKKALEYLRKAREQS